MKLPCSCPKMNAMWCFAVLLLHLLLGRAGAKPSLVTRMIPHPHTQSPDFSHSEFSLARMMQLQARVYDGTIGANISNNLPYTPLYTIALDMQYSAYKNVTLNVGIDTGSGLFWVKCMTNENTKYKLFSSPSYKEAKDCSVCTTGAMICISLKPTGCLNYIVYQSDVRIISRLGFDRVSFQSIQFDNAPDSVSTFDDILFGCVKTITGLDAPKMDGLLGLGTQPTSVLSQIGATQFSHCIGEKLTSPSPSDSIGDVLIIGDDYDMDYFVHPNLDSTPFPSSSYHYQVSLVGISFGETWIEVDDDLGDTLFDLGASLNSLRRVTHNALFYQISGWMEAHSFKPAQHFGKTVCYEGNLEDIEDTFPVTSYHFDGGAELELDKHNMFMQVSVPQRVCLNLMDPEYTSGYSYNLVGQTFQKNQYIKYDLANNRMYMTKVHCAGVIKDSAPGLI